MPVSGASEAQEAPSRAKQNRANLVGFDWREVETADKRRAPDCPAVQSGLEHLAGNVVGDDGFGVAMWRAPSLDQTGPVTMRKGHEGTRGCRVDFSGAALLRRSWFCPILHVSLAALSPKAGVCDAEILREGPMRSLRLIRAVFAVLLSLSAAYAADPKNRAGQVSRHHRQLQRLPHARLFSRQAGLRTRAQRLGGRLRAAGRRHVRRPQLDAGQGDRSR